MEVKNVDINSVIPYARNPRKNSLAVDKVAASIKEFGFKQPIVVDSENVIVVGHTRYAAAQKLGLEEVPVVVASELTPQQIKAYRIADNKTADYSTWDEELLLLEIEDLNNEGYDLNQTALSEEEINVFLNEADLLPDALPESDIVGVDQTADRFVVVYENEEEKQWFIDNLGFKDKILHTIKDFKDVVPE